MFELLRKGENVFSPITEDEAWAEFRSSPNNPTVWADHMLFLVKANPDQVAITDYGNLLGWVVEAQAEAVTG